MTSYLGSFNNLLSTTTSRYNSLRRNLLSNSSEDDTNVDHPDSTHVSRVLRAYYTEKHLPLPGWLPPGPNKPPPSQSQTQSFVSSRPFSSSRNNTSSGPYSSTNPYDNPSASNPARGSGGLGDIWGDSPSNAAPLPQNEGSLRRTAAMGASRRPGAGGAGGGSGGGYLDPRAAAQMGGGGGGQARPLPSQRAGSYQSVNRYTQDDDGGGLSRPGSAASAVSASSGRDRLKARMGSQRSGGLGGQGAGGGGGGGGGGGTYYGR